MVSNPSSGFLRRPGLPSPGPSMSASGASPTSSPSSRAQNPLETAGSFLSLDGDSLGPPSTWGGSSNALASSGAQGSGNLGAELNPPPVQMDLSGSAPLAGRLPSLRTSLLSEGLAAPGGTTSPTHTQDTDSLRVQPSIASSIATQAESQPPTHISMRRYGRPISRKGPVKDGHMLHTRSEGQLWPPLAPADPISAAHQPGISSASHPPLQAGRYMDLGHGRNASIGFSGNSAAAGEPPLPLKLPPPFLYTCVVGRSRSLARFTLNGSSDVAALLGRLAGLEMDDEFVQSL
ncbi:hypothetical protein WJX73_005468 [Symbiochloris irregularis]|uniref:Uncharacterized protein n=1 Tax=Symbiochloris irregularis TaxID=706552 RepID=A0AAW1P6X6_9CHLO